MNFSIKVNGELIDEKTIRKKLASYLASHEEQPDDLLNLQIELAHELVDELLLIQYGKEHKLMPSSEEIDFKKMKDHLSETTTTEDDIEEADIEEANIEEADTDFVEDISKELIIEKVTENALTKDLFDDDEYLETLYEQHKKNFNVGKAVEVSHILIKIGEANDELAQDKIKEALARLQEGEDFTKVAREVSECPSNERGGYLGFIFPGLLNKTFEKRAFKIKKNDISDIVKTEYGYHIIKVSKRVKNFTPPLKSVKEGFKSFITKIAKEEALDNLLFHLREKAEIEYIGLK